MGLKKNNKHNRGGAPSCRLPCDVWSIGILDRRMETERRERLWISATGTKNCGELGNPRRKKMGFQMVSIGKSTMSTNNQRQSKHKNEEIVYDIGIQPLHPMEQGLSPANEHQVREKVSFLFQRYCTLWWCQNMERSTIFKGKPTLSISFNGHGQ